MENEQKIDPFDAIAPFNKKKMSINIDGKKFNIISKSSNGMNNDLASLRQFVQKPKMEQAVDQKGLISKLIENRRLSKAKPSRLSIPNSNFNLADRSRNQSITLKPIYNTVDNTNQLAHLQHSTISSNSQFSNQQQNFLTSHAKQTNNNPFEFSNNSTFGQYRNSLNSQLNIPPLPIHKISNANLLELQPIQHQNRNLTQDSLESDAIPSIRTFIVQGKEVIPTQKIYQKNLNLKNQSEVLYLDSSHIKSQRVQPSQNDRSQMQRKQSLTTANLGTTFQITKRKSIKMNQDKSIQYQQQRQSANQSYLLDQQNKSIASTSKRNLELLQKGRFTTKQREMLDSVNSDEDDESQEFNSPSLKKSENNSLSDSIQEEDSSIQEESEKKEQSSEISQENMRMDSHPKIQKFNLNQLRDQDNYNKRYQMKRYSYASSDPYSTNLIPMPSDHIISFQPDNNSLSPSRKSSRSINPTPTIDKMSNNSKSTINNYKPNLSSKLQIGQISNSRQVTPISMNLKQQYPPINKQTRKSFLMPMVSIIPKEVHIRSSSQIPKGMRSYQDFLKKVDEEEQSQGTTLQQPAKKPPIKKPSSKNNLGKFGGKTSTKTFGSSNKKKQFQMKGKNF
eukprot:403345328